MDRNWIKVQCNMADCMHYHADPKGSPDLILCSHKDKPNYMEHGNCPLYRMDWQKKAAMAQNLVKMLKR